MNTWLEGGFSGVPKNKTCVSEIKIKISKEVNVFNSIGPPEVLQSKWFLLFLDCYGCHCYILSLSLLL